MNRREFIAGSVTALAVYPAAAASEPYIIRIANLPSRTVTLPPVSWAEYGDSIFLDENIILTEIPWKEDV